MEYLYSAIKPTRLYIKKCSHCNLKYFGKYTGEHIEYYKGSGTRWNNHLNKHSAASLHIWDSDWYSDTSISRFALKFSRINRIVQDENWANLKEETGLEGGWDHINNGSDLHIERARIGGKNSAYNIKDKGVKFSSGDERTILLSRKANSIKIQKLIDNPEYKSDYYKKVSEYQKLNNSMKDKCWCVPINCVDKNKEKRVFKIDQIPSGWVSCKDFNQSNKNKKNPTYGKMWIHNTDLKENKYINSTDKIPEGWTKGRKMKF
jgi:hypothetical protein